MRTRLNLSILTLIITLFSCSTSKFVTSNDQYPKINLNLNADLVVVEDKRENVDVIDDLAIPFVIPKGHYATIIPPFKSEYEEIIRQTLIENLRLESTNSVLFVVQLVNGRKELSAKTWTLRQTSFVKMKIVAKIEGKEIDIVESGEFFNKTIYATDKKTETFFKKTLKEVTYRALKQLESKISS